MIDNDELMAKFKEAYAAQAKKQKKPEVSYMNI